MASQIHSQDYNTTLGRSPSAKGVLLILSFKRLGSLHYQGALLWVSIHFAHFALWCIARIIPGFDPSGNLVAASLFTTLNMGIFYAFCYTHVTFFAFFVPFVMRYKECTAQRSFGPANALRDKWTPAVWTPGVQRVCGYLCVAGTFACIAGRQQGHESHPGTASLDPFHAAVVGVLGWGIWHVVRNREVVERIRREDEGDGVCIF